MENIMKGIARYEGGYFWVDLTGKDWGFKEFKPDGSLEDGSKYDFMPVMDIGFRLGIDLQKDEAFMQILQNRSINTTNLKEHWENIKIMAEVFGVSLDDISTVDSLCRKYSINPEEDMSLREYIQIIQEDREFYGI